MLFKRLSLLLLTVFFLQGALPAHADSKAEVIVETSKGTFTLELYPEKAPKTVANFLTYVDDGFYDNTIFHRIIADFVIQGGGFEKGMKPKKTRKSVENESGNRLKNLTGTIAMARKTHPDTATSQFFINLNHNARLDWKADFQPGYTVFGRVSQGMDVIAEIARVPTTTLDRMQNVPREDTYILSARRKAPEAAKTTEEKAQTETESAANKAAEQTSVKGEDSGGKEPPAFVAGQHYEVLERAVPTRNSDKIEVVEMFSYGCPHCYEFEAMIREWSRQQAGDVDFWVMPAVWNKSMAMYARAFYAARELNVSEIIHHPLFTAIVIEQRKISTEKELEDFFARYGVNRQKFNEAFHSSAVTTEVKHAEERVRLYKPMGVPEIVVNGKYRIGRMGAGGLAEMLPVLDFLVDKERKASASLSPVATPE
jgi:cyclophilin family peptidyl-prolyl cis-trans isomerase/predicted DsbA family dithiol-disulfide isomerase